MADEPLLDVRGPAYGEDDNLVAVITKTREELAGAGAGRMEVIGAAPTIELIQDPIQIDTHDERFGHKSQARIIDNSSKTAGIDSQKRAKAKGVGR